jgi:Ca2+-binding EF-hand superfamily protein
MRLLVAIVLFLAAPAFAQDKPAAKSDDSASGGATAPRPSFRRDASASQALFDRLDKNRDGYLTGSELTSQEALTTNWLAVDRDGDGRISRSEFTAIQGGDVATTQRP